MTVRSLLTRRARTPGPHPLRVPRRGTLLAGLVCAAVGWLAGGTDGLLSAGLGALVVVAFFSTGVVPLFLANQGGLRVGMGLAMLLLTYTLRLAVVLVALRLADRAHFLDGTWFGLTVIACALVWSGLQVAVVLRSRDT